MKLAFLAVVATFSLSSFAQDLAQSHAEICSGTKLPCRVVFTMVNQPMAGSCTGKLRGNIPCLISYSVSESSRVNVLCGDAFLPVKKENAEASAQSYNVSAIVTKTEKEEVLFSDPRLYTHIETSGTTLFMARDKSTAYGSIVLRDKTGASLLTDVKCN